MAIGCTHGRENEQGRKSRGMFLKTNRLKTKCVSICECEARAIKKACL